MLTTWLSLQPSPLPAHLATLSLSPPAGLLAAKGLACLVRRMVRYLQRVSTVGGLAPTRPCTQGEFVTSPYSATVLLYG